MIFGKELHVVRPHHDCDYIYIIVDEDEQYYYTSNRKKYPKSIVDSGKSWHGNYYFSNKKDRDNWIENVYNKMEEIINGTEIKY